MGTDSPDGRHSSTCQSEEEPGSGRHTGCTAVHSSPSGNGGMARNTHDRQGFRIRTASHLLGQDSHTYCRVCLGFRSLGSWEAIAHPCPGGTVIFWASRMKVLMPTCVHTGPRGPGRLYTPRKNMWWEVFPAWDTRLQCHRYDATVAWGRLEEAPARIIPVLQARGGPSPTGSMASPG